MKSSKNVWESVEQNRKALNVQRLSGSVKLRSYNLAEHQYFVGMMYLDIAREYKIVTTLRQIDVVFRHDMMETLTGDLIFTAKNLNRSVAECWAIIEENVQKSSDKMGVYTDFDIESIMDPEKLLLLKLCDITELYLFCVEECRIGNFSEDIKTVIHNCKIIKDRLMKDNTYEFLDSIEIFYKNTEDVFVGYGLTGDGCPEGVCKTSGIFVRNI